MREEVEENLLSRAAELSPAVADQVIDDYSKLLKLARPEIIPLPLSREVARSRHLIRHAADVPVLLSAMQAQPDWLLTHNTQHFTVAVAKRTGLRIATSMEFFCALAEEIS